MISQVSIWAKGLIVITLIGTVLQMLLPEGNNKKYIKIIIGIFIVFTVLKPVVGNSINFDNININEYVNNNENKKEKTTNNDVKNLFEDKIISTIKEKLINMRL